MVKGTRSRIQRDFDEDAYKASTHREFFRKLKQYRAIATARTKRPKCLAAIHLAPAIIRLN
jgi:hypothetical protein